MITIRQLAKKLELSPATVSMVLNSAPLARYIPEETQSRVRAAADKFGYYPNQFARSLRSSRSGFLGILLSDVSDPYCAEVLQGIVRSLYSTPYVPILIDIENSSRKFRSYVRVLLERRIEGVISIANSLFLKADALSVFSERGLPVVAIGRGTELAGIASVSIDNETGTYAAMKHMYELGHRCFAFVKGPRKVIDSIARWRGVERFSKEIGLRIDPKLVVQLSEPASSAEAGLAAIKALVSRKRPFSVVMAFDDTTAFGVIRGLNILGRRVPEDCSVFGFDNVAASEFYAPPLSTIDQRMADLGKTAVEEFFSQIDAVRRGISPKAQHRILEPRLIARMSTGPIQK